MGLVILIGIVTGLLVATMTNIIANNIAEKYVFSEEKMQETMKSRQSAFQEYVTQRNLSSLDSSVINAWAEENGGVSLMIYKENKLILKTGETATTVPTTQVPATEIDEEDPWVDDDRRPPHPEDDRRDPYRPGWEYYRDDSTTEEPTETPTAVSTEPTTVVYEVFTGDENDIVYAQEPTRSALETLLLTKDSGYVEVQFSDGKAIVCFIDNTAKQADGIITLVSLLTSFITFAVLILIYYTKKVNQVVSLAHTVHRVGDGELDLPVHAQGSDEIALLADEVDAMRCSVAEKIENEKQASAAANELVTTMSHDIRTPLTALIGYLDLLEENNAAKNNDDKKYIEACRSKAQQLKNLSDRLFNYFLVYGHTMTTQPPEYIDAQIFLAQVLGEQAQYLLSNGLSVQYTPYEKSGLFYIDANEVCRVFDNVFSNIVRYADRDYPVFISTQLHKDSLVIGIENRINEHAEHNESSGLGLKICSRVMQQCGGSFAASQDDGVFSATLMLPLYKDENRKNT